MSTPVSGIQGRVNPEGYLSTVCHSPLRDSKRAGIEKHVLSRFRLLIQQILLGVFLEINVICPHVQAVDIRPSFPPPQRPGYEAMHVYSSYFHKWVLVHSTFQCSDMS